MVQEKTKARNKPEVQQAKQYDRIFKENIEPLLPGIMKHLIGMDVPLNMEELPDSIQHTMEREPDVLKKVIDVQGNAFLLQIEFQVKNETKMVGRMLEYFGMLWAKYGLPITQCVVYIGKGSANMPTELHMERIDYQLLSVSSVDYQLFLQSERPEEKMLAILADFKGENSRIVAEEVVRQIVAVSRDSLDIRRYMKQLSIFGKLRNLVPINEVIMDNLTKYILEETDIETDFFYQKGEKKGLEKGLEKGEKKKSLKVIRNLLTLTQFDTAEIARIADVPEAFVRRVQEENTK